MSKPDDILNELKELKEDPPFIVPKGYFDTFPEKIKAKIEQEEPTAKPTLIQIMKPWIGIAAGFFLILALYFTFAPAKTNTETAGNNVELNNPFYNFTFDPVSLEFNEYDLACYLSDDDKTDITGNDNSEPDVDLSDLTMQDIDDLILF